MLFNELSLHKEVLGALSDLDLKELTPIQRKAIPPALEGKDVLGSAQTGSGKTLAFSLPLAQRLLDKDTKRGKGARAVILTPVRELAAQIEAVIGDCTRRAKLRTALLIGGASMRAQVDSIRNGADIIIATPGRLLDHLRRTRGFDLGSCKVLVLDEADRMLDMGFLPDVSKILAQVPASRQTLMFSATVPKEIEGLVSRFMREPVRIQIDPPRRPAQGVVQRIYPVSSTQKYDLLFALIEAMSMDSALVFVSMKRRATVVSNFLKSKKIAAGEMHSDLSQSIRSRTLQDFRDQRHRVLVATDVAARGLDIRHVSHVVNFDVPLYAEDYLHRIGRTARVFTIGDALTLMSPEEKKPVESIERFIGETIKRCALEGFPYTVPPRLEAYHRPTHSRFMFKRSRGGRTRRGIF